MSVDYVWIKIHLKFIFRACRVIFITPLERLKIWNYWLVSRIMSVGFGILAITRKKEGQIMNLDEFKAHVLETRRQSAVSVVNVIINSTKKEGSK